MQNKRIIGAKYEQMAGRYLETLGYRVLEYNVHSRYGELDIVAMDGAYLVFVEVKYRGSLTCGHPLEAVDRKKQRTICHCATFYMQKNGLENLPVRFDVVSIVGDVVEVVANAFEFIR